MAYSFGYEIKQLLFSSINVTTITGVIIASICTIVLVLIFEASKIGLAFSKYYSAFLRPNENLDCFTDDMLLVENQTPSRSRRYAWLLIEVGLYIVEILLSYIAMLLVMTYNGYLMLSVIIASGIGYFLGGQILITVKIKTSKLNIPCNHCSSHQKNSSITSSTEAITETIEEQDHRCCAKESSDVIVVAETKY